MVRVFIKLCFGYSVMKSAGLYFEIFIGKQLCHQTQPHPLKELREVIPEKIQRGGKKILIDQIR